jgi:intein/homing endonuclease
VCHKLFIPKTHGSTSSHEFELDWNFGFMMGMVVAEGCVSQNKLVCIAAKDVELRRALFNVITACGLKGHRDAHDRVVNIYDAPFAQWCGDNVGHLAPNKRIPDIFFGAPEEARAGFVAGYWAGDGRVGELTDGRTKDTDTITTSRPLRDGLGVLMASLGISTTHGEYPAPTDRASDIYRLGVSCRDAHKIPAFEHTCKMARLNALVASYKGKKHGDSIPLTKDRIRFLRDEAKRKYGSRSALYARLNMQCRTETRTSLVPKADVLNLMEQEKGVAERLTADWIQWDVVKEVEPIEYDELVYDFEIQPHNTFMCIDTLFVHNSNFEDGIVISEAAANKLTSEHMYQSEVPREKSTVLGKDQFVSSYPGKFNKEQLAKIGPDGMPKPGTVLHKGDPVILAVRRNLPGPGSMGRHTLSNVSEIWEHDVPGVVTGSVEGKDAHTVFVRANMPMRDGDKMAGRSGNKGVVTVIPDDQMPKGQDGKPLDVLMSPMGLISRTNPSQIFEALLGKVAEKTGKTIVLPSFSKGDMAEYVAEQLRKHDLSDVEDLIDPEDGAVIPEILTGKAYFYKLKHTAESKESGRGSGEQYTLEDTPGSGGYGGSKRLGGLEISALMGHGVMDFMKDAKLIRGQCFTADTEVLVRRGWLRWDEVLDTDEFYTRSKQDATAGWYEKPERLVVNPYEGELFGYEGRHVSWLVTPNHKFWGVKGTVSRSKPWRKHRSLTAAEIFGADCSMDAYGAVYQGSLGLDYKVHIEARSRKARCLDIDIIDYCRLLGWWLSEGCASVDQEGRGRIRISQSMRANPEKFAEIEALVRRIGFTGVVYERVPSNPGPSGLPGTTAERIPGEVIGLRVNSQPLAEHLRTLGDRSWNKKLPAIVFEAPVEARRELLRCFVAGDGCVRNTGGAVQFYMSSASEELIQGLQRLALISGMSAHTGSCHNESYKHPHYRLICGYNLTEVSVLKRPASTFKGHFKQTYTGLVYCATMPTGMLYVKRDGKTMWSENSNDDFWRDFRMGRTPVMPGEPLVNKKFYAHLRGSGINIRRQKDRVELFGASDNDMQELTQKREVKSTNTFNAKTFEPMEGGLFGSDVFGIEGDQWGFVQLDEPVPNPVMEDSLRRILNMKVKDFRAVAAGQMELDGEVGGQALLSKLEQLNPKAEMRKELDTIKGSTGQKRDSAIKRYRALASIDKQGLHPKDFMLTRIPVIPPKFRPVTTSGDMTMVADSNYLYKRMLEARDDLREAKDVLPDEEIAASRNALYSSFRQLVGLEDPDDVKLKQKNVGGLLQWVFGKGSPKTGAFQARIISTAQDTVGRGTIVPNPSLKLNQIGLPEEQAWDVYEPFVVRQLVGGGYPTTDAVRMVADRHPVAYDALRKAVESRPTVFTRAPVLHKYGIMGFWPVLTKGSTIQVSPSIVEPLGADFDGDTANFHVPVSQAAVNAVVDRMMPEKNLLNVRRFKPHYLPIREYQQGLYLATRIKPGQEPVRFRTAEEAKQAMHDGKIKIDTPVRIG